MCKYFIWHRINLHLIVLQCQLGNFIPRRRYIYICPRVHLILFIFIIRGFFYLWVMKLWFQKPLQILLLWNAENFYLVTVFGLTIFEELLKILEYHEIEDVVISPGSRSAPLTLAFSKNAQEICDFKLKITG